MDPVARAGARTERERREPGLTTARSRRRSPAASRPPRPAPQRRLAHGSACSSARTSRPHLGPPPPRGSRRRSCGPGTGPPRPRASHGQRAVGARHPLLLLALGLDARLPVVRRTLPVAGRGPDRPQPGEPQLRRAGGGAAAGGSGRAGAVVVGHQAEPGPVRRRRARPAAGAAAGRDRHPAAHLAARPAAAARRSGADRAARHGAVADAAVLLQRGQALQPRRRRRPRPGLAGAARPARRGGPTPDDAAGAGRRGRGVGLVRLGLRPGGSSRAAGAVRPACRRPAAGRPGGGAAVGLGPLARRLLRDGAVTAARLHRPVQLLGLHLPPTAPTTCRRGCCAAPST